MKFFTTTIITALLTVSATLSAQCPTRKVSTMAGNGNEYVAAMAADNHSDAYVVGTYNDNMQIGNDALSSGHRQKSFVAKCNKWGSPLWAFTTQGSTAGNDAATCLYVDTLQGYFYVAGWFTDTLTIKGQSVNTDTLSLYMAKLDLNGNLVWLRKGLSDTSLQVNGIAIGFNNHLLVLCSTPHFADNRVALLNYDNSGNFIWRKDIQGGYGLLGADIKVNASNNIYVSGTMYNSASFPGPLGVSAHGYGTGAFLAKLNTVGETQWAGFSMMDSIQQQVSQTHIALDNANHVVVTFKTTGSVSWQFGPLTGDNITGYGDYYLRETVMMAKVSQSDGTVSWLRPKITANSISNGGIAVPSDGDIFISVTFGGILDNGFANIYSHGLTDVAILNIDTGGVLYTNMRTGGSTANDIAGPIVLIGDYILGSGSIGGTATFDTLPGVNAPFVAGYDAFLWAINCDSTTGISEQPTTALYNLSLYPNPTNGNLTIAFDQPANGEANIAIMDMLGNKMIDNQLGYQEEGHHQVNIETSKLTAGLYLVEITGSKGKQIQRLVKID